MAWTIELSNRAERVLKKLDRQTARRIGEFIDNSLNGTDDPRVLGKPLKADRERYWGYRVGD